MTKTRDWTGTGQNAIYATLGASNHSSYDRVEHDYYATNPSAVDDLLAIETFDGGVWEPACGEGHISNKLIEQGIDTVSTDIIDRGFGQVADFFTATELMRPNIITNPPYKFAKEFVEKSHELGAEKVAMFLKLTFLEGQRRHSMFKAYPPRRVWVYSRRVTVARNGDPKMFAMSSAAAYAWFIWERGYTGRPEVDWIN